MKACHHIEPRARGPVHRAARTIMQATRPLWLKCSGLLFRIAAGHFRPGRLRAWVRVCAGGWLRIGDPRIERLWDEVSFVLRHHALLRERMTAGRGRRVLFAGQAYYNAWYLSRCLRELGWRADVLNWDLNPASQIYYHGEDFRFTSDTPYDLHRDLAYFLESLFRYDIFHFSNANGICFGFFLQHEFARRFGEHAEIQLLKDLGKKIVYANNGCRDGVSQSAFSRWGPESVCDICVWKNRHDVCSDERNLSWGEFRNRVSDYQILLGGNRVDFNAAPTVHEVPEFYCLDPELWRPDLEIPAQFRLPQAVPGTVRVYHAVGNVDLRTSERGVNIKSTHVYLPLLRKLESEGFAIELLSPSNMPNLEVRFIQAQCDIMLDMLTYGWFGATAREGMMLGKPVVCFIRPEWLESVRGEIPAYAEELPIVSATPDSVEAVLRDLIGSPEKRSAIGRASRGFAVKWHSAEAGARRFDRIYGDLLGLPAEQVGGR